LESRVLLKAHHKLVCECAETTLASTSESMNNNNNTTHWQQHRDIEEEHVLWYTDVDGPNGDSTPSFSLTPRDTSLVLSSLLQLGLPRIYVQRDRAPSPQCVASTAMMNSSSIQWASYSEPQYSWDQPHPHFFHTPPVHPSANPSVGAYGPQVHHNHFHPSPPLYVQHQPPPVQEQESFPFHGCPCVDAEDYFLHNQNTTPSPAQVQVEAFPDDSFPRDPLQPSPDAGDDDSYLNEYSTKSPRGKELFVYHVPFNMTNDDLRDLFSQYGVIIRASIARHQSGEPRSFGFVKFKLQSAADEALLRLNNYQVSML
jgi:hypothetical protein